jgi:hypothetical protein
MTDTRDDLQAIVDARDVAIMALRRQNLEFMDQLVEEEAVIQKLKVSIDTPRATHESALQKPSSEHDDLSRKHAEAVESLALAAQQLRAKESVIGDLKRAHDEASEKAAHVTQSLGSQLREKEAVLQLQHSQLKEKDALLEKIGTGQSDMLREHTVALAAIEQKICALHAAFAGTESTQPVVPLAAPALAPASPVPAAHQDLLRALEEKEACIHELSDALTAYRVAYPSIALVSRPLRAISSARRSLVRTVRRIIVPKLGNLNQHPPIELDGP